MVDSPAQLKCARFFLFLGGSVGGDIRAGDDEMAEKRCKTIDTMGGGLIVGGLGDGIMSGIGDS